MSSFIFFHSALVNAKCFKSLSAVATQSKASCSSTARFIMSKVEFHLVLTSNISSFGLISAAVHCRKNLSRRCRDARILLTSLRSYSKENNKKFMYKIIKNGFSLPLEEHHNGLGLHHHYYNQLFPHL